MKTTKQRYWLVLHARPDESVSVQAKHARFFAGIARLAEPWGLGEKEVPALKVGYGTTILNLAKFFGKAAHRAMLTYSRRRGPTDDGLDDDALTVTFDPAKVDTQYLIGEVLPVYIRVFDAYLVEYFDDLMIDTAAEQLKGLPVNPRRYVYRVGLVSFFDEQLCLRAFNLTPAQVVDRVQGKAERADLLHGGAYVVGASAPLPLGEAQAKCQELMAAVVGSGTTPAT